MTHDPKSPTNTEVHLMLILSMRLVDREASISDVCVQPGGDYCTAKIGGWDAIFPITHLGMMDAVRLYAPLKSHNQQSETADQGEDAGTASN